MTEKGLHFITARLLLAFGILAPLPSSAGSLADDVNCGLSSLFGGNCTEIERINKYQEQQQADWLSGSISGAQMVKNVVAYHQRLTAIDRYNKELYLYSYQVAQACDAGKITKEQGLYFMTKMENEIQERQRAGQPPANRAFTCVTESFAGTATTRCQ